MFNIQDMFETMCKTCRRGLDCPLHPMARKEKLNESKIESITGERVQMKPNNKNRGLIK